MQIEKSQPSGQRILPETRQTSFPALSVYHRVGISRSASKTDDRFYLSSTYIYLLRQVHFQFQGYQVCFVFTDLSVLKRPIFKANSLDPDQQHFWRLMRFYTVCRCLLMGVQTCMIELNKAEASHCIYFILSLQASTISRSVILISF